MFGASVLAVVALMAFGMSPPAFASATTTTVIPKSDAIKIARHGCRMDWSKLPIEAWAARRQGTEWRVWTSSPRDGDPDAASTYVAFQVWMDARTGLVRVCNIRTE
jgi:hypothetical protein